MCLCSYFLESLKSCIQDPVQLAKVIKDRSRKLGMYVVYSQNKPLSEHILSEHSAYFNEIRLKLKQKLTVSQSPANFRFRDSFEARLVRLLLFSCSCLTC